MTGKMVLFCCRDNELIGDTLNIFSYFLLALNAPKLKMAEFVNSADPDEVAHTGYIHSLPCHLLILNMI